jgi:hypothetical protein
VFVRLFVYLFVFWFLDLLVGCLAIFICLFVGSRSDRAAAVTGQQQ